MEKKDKVTISITLEREVNGTISRSTDISGEGFHYFELIGMLQITCYDFAQQSISTARDLPKDKPVHLVFDSAEGEKI
jgi:hypothetical protein